MSAIQSCITIARADGQGPIASAAQAELLELRQQVEGLKKHHDEAAQADAATAFALHKAEADRDHYRELVKEMAEVLRLARIHVIGNDHETLTAAIDALLARCEGEK